MTLRNHQDLFFALIIFHFFTTSFPSVSTHVFPSPIGGSSIHNHKPWEALLLYNNFTTYHCGQNYKGLSNIKSYLHHLGYIPNVPPSNFTNDFDDNLKSSIQTYQKYHHLNVTGELDRDTLLHMMIPRCGVPDIIKHKTTNTASFSAHSPHTVSRYAFFNRMPRWPVGTTQLTYAFSPQSSLIDAFKNAFASAFNKWTPVVNISFQETTSYDNAKIKIGFFKGAHGDGHPFDGPGGILAHSFSPTDGRSHFDGDEIWAATNPFDSELVAIDAFDLESVAVHEIGHILGLNHTTDQTAIMYPTIQSGTRKVDLAPDDIQGIRALYKL